ncbi:MAG: hypothetical protein EOM08_14770 [Clostridia bacterium]|nr:hypothetical protein [Clostridia bacterium]
MDENKIREMVRSVVLELNEERNLDVFYSRYFDKVKNLPESNRIEVMIAHSIKLAVETSTEILIRSLAAIRDID